MMAVSTVMTEVFADDREDISMTGRILIAEDEPFILESLTFLLKREGYHLSGVQNGSAVIDAVERERPDLLVLDAMLPGMDGFSILAGLRRGSGADLPVLVLTAKGQQADRRRMLELGANAFITKPFANRDVLETVAKLIGERDTARGA